MTARSVGAAADLACFVFGDDLEAVELPFQLARSDSCTTSVAEPDAPGFSGWLGIETSSETLPVRNTVAELSMRILRHCGAIR